MDTQMEKLSLFNFLDYREYLLAYFDHRKAVSPWYSYKVFGENSLAPVTAKVHYLPPLSYEDYKDMNSREICALVKTQIQKAIDDELEARKNRRGWFHRK